MKNETCCKKISQDLPVLICVFLGRSCPTILGGAPPNSASLFPGSGSSSESGDGWNKIVVGLSCVRHDCSGQMYIYNMYNGSIPETYSTYESWSQVSAFCAST